MEIVIESVWQKAKETAKKAGEVAKNVITVGGYSALQESIAAYDAQLERHRESVNAFETANSAFRSAVESLGTETTECMTLLRASQEFVQRLSYAQFSSKLPNLPVFDTPDLSRVTATLARFDAGINAGVGAGLGLAASTGAWVLVAHLGVASTGAAISGLAGIAAHNAILAWFGGGALAAGGGGMLLGSLAIGALVLLPMVGYSTYKSYKEATRIDNERKTVGDSATTNCENADKLLCLRDSAESLRAEIVKKRITFTTQFETLRTEALHLAEKAAVLANEFAESFLLREGLTLAGSDVPR
jgi:uncharacterized membrane protein YebE (DUF533 family)